MKYKFIRRLIHKQYYIAGDNKIWSRNTETGEEIITECELDMTLSVGDKFLVKKLNCVYTIQKVIKSEANEILCYIKDRIINLDAANKEFEELKLIQKNPPRKINPKTNMFLKVLRGL